MGENIQRGELWGVSEGDRKHIYLPLQDLGLDWVIWERV